MHILRRVLWFIGSLAALGVGLEVVSQQPGKKPRREYGLEKREAWTTSRVVGSPEPPAPYRMENAFPKIKFDEPLELAAVPGSDRWVVAQRKGKIFTFANDLKATEKHLLIDLGK